MPAIRPRSLLLFALAGLIVVIVDRATKVWALARLADAEGTHWILGNILGLHLQYNYGASFSIGTNATWIFTLIGLATVIILPFFAGNARAWALTLGAVWGGALGNLADRLFSRSFGRGPVTDFIVYGHWFTGNVADIALVLGVIILVFLMVKGHAPLKVEEGKTRG